MTGAVKTVIQSDRVYQEAGHKPQASSAKRI